MRQRSFCEITRDVADVTTPITKAVSPAMRRASVYLKELVVAQARAVARAGFGEFSSTTRHFPSMRSTSPRSASLPMRVLTVLVLEPTRRASSATPAFGAARIASSKRPSEALTSSGVGRFPPMSFRRVERGGVRAAANAGGRGSSPFGVARGL